MVHKKKRSKRGHWCGNEDGRSLTMQPMSVGPDRRSADADLDSPLIHQKNDPPRSSILTKSMLPISSHRSDDARDPVQSPERGQPTAPSGHLRDNVIYRGDARELMAQIRPESIALSFWSPPYFVGKSYERDLTFAEWQSLLRVVIELHFEAVRPGGFLVINISDILAFPDPHMPKVQADNVSIKRSPVSRADVVNALIDHPSFNRNQLAALLGCSEQTIQRRLEDNNVRGGKYGVQTKVKLVGGLIQEWGESAGFYLYDRRAWIKDPCWANSRWHSLSYRSVDEFEYIYVFWKPGITTIDRERLSKSEWAEWGSRGVWNIPSVRSNEEHEAMFPIELARRVIRLFSAPDELVLDPFVGSGTTVVAAVQDGRRYLGFELLPSYAALASQRLEAIHAQTAQ
jgi:DNA modification methylase